MSYPGFFANLQGGFANLPYFVSERLQQQCAFAHTHPRPCVTRATHGYAAGQRLCVRAEVAPSSLPQHTRPTHTHDLRM